MESYFEPLDDKELRDHLRLQLPPTDARAGWQFDEVAFLKAIDLLGIKLPVRVRFMTGRYRLGTHYARVDHHRITIHQAGSVTVSNNTIWHELAHAMQSERWAEKAGQANPSGFYRRKTGPYVRAAGRYGASYKENRYEIEARQIADNAPFTIIQRGLGQ